MNWLKQTWAKITGQKQEPHNSIQLVHEPGEKDFAFNLGISIDMGVDAQKNVKVCVGSLVVTSANERGKVYLDQADDASMARLIHSICLGTAMFAREEAAIKGFLKTAVPTDDETPAPDKTHLN